MATSSNAALARELAALQEENDRLKREIGDVTELLAPPPRRSRAVWRTIIAVVFITIGALLAPLALVASWAATEVSDTDRFVASLAPLSHDPQVRTAIGTAVVTAIENRIDIDGYTNDAFDGLASLARRPAVANAVKGLAPAAADGIRNLLNSSVHDFIESKQFQTVWDRALRLSHNQLDAILTNDTSRALVVGDDGKVGIQLAPIITQVKAQLTKANFPLASRIPVIDRTVVVATVQHISQVRAAYQLLLSLSAVLPWIGLVLLVLGVAIARNRPRATVGAGIGLVVATAVLLVALVVVRFIAGASVVSHGISQGVTHTIFDTLTTQIRAAGLALVLVGLTAAAIGFLLGRSRQAVAIRSVWGHGMARAHRFLDRHRIGNRRFGVVLYRARYAVWAAIAVIVAVILLFSRPLTPTTVGVVALVVAVFALLYALFQRPEPEVTVVVVEAG
jgi:hypothetical protein